MNRGKAPPTNMDTPDTPPVPDELALPPMETPATPPQPKPRPQNPVRAPGAKIFTLKTATLFAVIILLVGFLLGWAAAPNEPKDGAPDEMRSKLATSEAYQKVVEQKVSVAEAAQKLAESKIDVAEAKAEVAEAKVAIAEAAKTAAEAKAAAAETSAKEMEAMLEGFQELTVPEGFALPEGTARLWGSK